MEYKKKNDLKVECIVSQEDFEFFGITFDDILDRSQAGMRFIKKAKEGAQRRPHLGRNRFWLDIFR